MNGYTTNMYTWNLPYGVRREICDLLDADQSWRTLGGQFMGLDATQLALIGQVYLRCSSPTEELMHRLDSANTRIVDLCLYLERMNHYRALDILKPYLNGGDDSTGARVSQPQTTDQTLLTPTPSFSERPSSLMECIDFGKMVQEHSDAGFTDQVVGYQNNKQQSIAFKEQQQCHKPHLALSTEEAPTRPIERRNIQPPQYRGASPTGAAEANAANKKPDPGEEIVRMACATNRKRTSISNQEVVNQIRLILHIQYKELKLASNDFADSNILGNGGFASVYRGNWKGTDVAIKRLKCNLMDQALNELTILNSYRIDNILPIYGVSIDGPEACLVYQFMSNGSLEDRLSCKKGTKPLTWTQRAVIGEGIAKGLHYLHTLRDKPLVHGDVKSANVLLDSQFVPKLGDFGLARQVFRGKNPQTEVCTSCTVSSIHGTSVYLPPEYLRHKTLSPAVDVYSYGVVLLEMATGKRAYDGRRLLIDLVQSEIPSMAMGEISYSLKDPKLADDTQKDLKIWFELLIKLGLVCAHKIKRKRPLMRDVLDRYMEFFTLAAAAESQPENASSRSQVMQSPHFTLGSLRAPSTLVGSTKPSRVVEQDIIQEQQHEVYPQPAADAKLFNSNLMSVEEDLQEASKITPIVQNGLNMQNNNGVVDAMIPLLSEFNISVEPKS